MKVIPIMSQFGVNSVMDTVYWLTTSVILWVTDVL